MPTFQTGGFGTWRWATFQIEEGKSATQIVGTEGMVGDAHARLPDVLLQRPRLQARSTFGFLFDWQQGSDIINLTEFLYDAGQNSADFDVTRRAAVRLSCGRRSSTRASSQGTCRTARFLKLREVTLTYNLPRVRHPRALRIDRAAGRGSR